MICPCNWIYSLCIIIYVIGCIYSYRCIVNIYGLFIIRLVFWGMAVSMGMVFSSTKNVVLVILGLDFVYGCIVWFDLGYKVVRF